MKKPQRLELLITCGVFFLLSLAYRILYRTVLHDIVSRTYNPIYGMILGYIVNPIFYFTLGSLLTAIIYLFALKPVPQHWRKYCTLVSAILVTVYLVTVTLTNFIIKDYYIIVSFVLMRPWLFLLPGVLLSIGIVQKDHEATAS